MILEEFLPCTYFNGHYTNLDSKYSHPTRPNSSNLVHLCVKLPLQNGNTVSKDTYRQISRNTFQQN